MNFFHVHQPPQHVLEPWAAVTWYSSVHQSVASTVHGACGGGGPQNKENNFIFEISVIGKYFIFCFFPQNWRFFMRFRVLDVKSALFLRLNLTFRNFHENLA